MLCFLKQNTGDHGEEPFQLAWYEPQWNSDVYHMQVGTALCKAGAQLTNLHMADSQLFPGTGRVPFGIDNSDQH